MAELCDIPKCNLICQMVHRATLMHQTCFEFRAVTDNQEMFFNKNEQQKILHLILCWNLVEFFFLFRISSLIKSDD